MTNYATVLLVSLSAAAIYLCQGKTADEYMNTCMKFRFQKETPGPEPNLFGECASWKDNACCSYNTTEARKLEDSQLGDHCHGQNLSVGCRRFFLRDICFNQCSPNLGPWDKAVPGYKRTFHIGLPICQSSCDDWWDACKDDYTCVANWWKEFNWTTDIATCPANTTCKRFSEFHTGAKGFCETIWHESYKVVPNTEDDCLVLYWPPGNTNPNVRVARAKANELALASHQSASFGIVVTLLLFTLSRIY